jgi:polar amino acid transport system substrate-binding protein
VDKIKRKEGRTMVKPLCILLTAALFLPIILIGNVQTDKLNTALEKIPVRCSADTVNKTTKNIQTAGASKKIAGKKSLSYTTAKESQKTAVPKISKYTIVTENFPPFSYKEKGKLVGISTEIVQEILNRLKMKGIPIEVMDWNEAYQKTLNKDNAIIYSLTKIKQRENKFKWVGPIATNYWFLLSLKKPTSGKEKDIIKIRNLKDAKKYSIGVQKEGAIYQYLKSKGFTNLITSTSNKTSAENLLNNKVQLWGESELVAASLLKQLKKDPKDTLRKTFKLKRHNLYIGFNIKTSNSLVKKFQTVLDKMKSDGAYDKIVNKYYNKIYEKK